MHKFTRMIIGLGCVRISLPRSRFTVMLLCVLAISLGGPGMMLGRGYKEKTLERDLDAVIMKAGDLDSLLGSPIDRLGLLALAHGELEPIPFQIDERDKKDRYVYELGTEPNPDPDPALDANDELVFMSWDSGDRLDRPLELPGAEAAVEIELYDPVDAGMGWVYLVRFDGRPPLSDRDYVDYDPEGDEIEGERYILGYSKRAPISIGRQLVKPEAGGSGKSIADRMKIRFQGKVILGLVQLDINEDGFTTEVTGYKDGPVRVLRRTANWQYLWRFIPTPRTYLNTQYFGRMIGYSLRFHVPFDVHAFLTEPVVRVSTDSTCERPGRRWYNSENPQGVAVDGWMSEEEMNLDRAEFSWTVVASNEPGEEGGWLSRNVYDRDAFPIWFELFYQDDMSTPDPPEEEPGSCGNTGYHVYGLENIERGDYELGVVMFPIPGYEPGDETPYLMVHDDPLQIAVRDVEVR